MRNCPYCAKLIDDDALFCKHCGREAAPLPAAAGEGQERNVPPQPVVEFSTEPAPVKKEPAKPVKPAPTPLSRTLPYILILVFVLCILLGVLSCVISGITSVLSSG